MHLPSISEQERLLRAMLRFGEEERLPSSFGGRKYTRCHTLC
jgi:hypothetical protein